MIYTTIENDSRIESGFPVLNYWLRGAGWSWICGHVATDVCEVHGLAFRVVPHGIGEILSFDPIVLGAVVAAIINHWLNSRKD